MQWRRDCDAAPVRGDAALKAVNRTQVTSMPGVPTMYQALLDNAALPKTDFSSLRACISGGAPLAAELKAKFEASRMRR
jgi:long-chain acyl-CoA synthetase